MARQDIAELGLDDEEAEEEEDNKEHYLAFVLSSGLFLSLEKSLRGSIPKRKVTAATPNRIKT